MSASTALFALLSGNAGVTAIVGAGSACKIYPDVIPLNADLPAIAYTVGATAIATIHGSVLGEESSIAVACWAATRTDADALAVAVQLALISAGRVWSSRSNAFDDDVGCFSSTVSLDWF